MTSHDIAVLLLAMGVVLAVARTLGEVAQWMRQPAVVGEILAGVLLGPTVLGALFPDWHAAVFPAEGVTADVYHGISTLAITLFLLVAGIEVDLSTAWRQGNSAFKVSLLGMIVPFALGFLCAWLVPRLMGSHDGADPWTFSLFFATALSISALPVIAKTLLDLDLYRSDLGMIIVSAAMVNDIVGWLVFALVLGMMGPEGGEAAVTHTIVLTLLFTAGMLTVGRWIVHRVLPYIQAYTHWPGGVLSFALSLALFAGAITEWIGIHAIFGAFLAGVAIGDSSHLRERTRTTIDNFVSFFFAPLFFGSIGLHIDFRASFHWHLVLTVLVISCVGKVAGCLGGAAWAGMSRRDGWAVAWGMNARGAMEIILGLLALEAGVIRTRLFVALVVMAIVTSMMSGPLVQWLVGHKKTRSVLNYLSTSRFRPRLSGGTRARAIEELVQAACAGTTLNVQLATDAVLAREAAMHTGIGHGLAVPHGRLEALTAPLVAVGISEGGIDFDSPDGLPAHIVFLILTPVQDNGLQLELLASLARMFKDESVTNRLRQARSYTEALAVLKSVS